MTASGWRRLAGAWLAVMLASSSVWAADRAASARGSAAGGEAPAAERTLELVPVVEDLDSPVCLTHAGDGSGRLFIVEQAGRIKIRFPDRPWTGEFLSITDRVVSGGEMGLLGLAFHPRFKQNGRLFVNYTARDRGRLKTVIAEYRVSDNEPDQASRFERRLLELDQPYSNHNGGQLAFGPDGFLYIGLGDGGGAGDPHRHGQNLKSLLGKILRIDVNAPEGYRIPSDNPFVEPRPAGSAAGPAPEVWAYGLRNPWRFSFDRATGRLFAGDVGQDRYEEIDLVERGGNYGWNLMEGTHCYPPSSDESCNPEGLVLPIAEYDRTEGISVTGGYVYHGQAAPSLQGQYIFGDFGSSAMWALTETSPGRWQRRALLQAPQPISSFGEDEIGELYVVGYEGTIFRISDVPEDVDAQPEIVPPTEPGIAIDDSTMRQR